MASDGGFTGDLPMNILSNLQVKTRALEAMSDDTPVAQLKESVNRGFDGDAAILLAIFRDRCETIPLDPSQLSTRLIEGFSPQCLVPR
jgi:hypothetical protein